MVDLFTGKPSGFGRFISFYKIIDGQFYQDKMHGIIRKISQKSSSNDYYPDTVEVISYENNIKNGFYKSYDGKNKLIMEGTCYNNLFTGSRYSYTSMFKVKTEYLEDKLI